MTYIKGNYRRSIYQTSSGYNIGIFKVKETNDDSLNDYVNHTITFTGYFHELNDYDTYIFHGKLIKHPKYGEQFQVEKYERCKPEAKESIISFLTSGLFKGIGEKKAEKIVDVLGKDTLKIILENPNNLTLIPTITEKNIEILHNGLKEYEASYETILFLNKLGFTTKDSIIIYNKYNDTSIEKVNNNIYQLIDDILELDFKKIDHIALEMGIQKDSPIRIKASLIYIMEQLSNTYGHSYYYANELQMYLPRVLNISITPEEFTKQLNALEEDMKIIIKDEKIYLTQMYEAETFIVKRIRLLNSNEGIKIKDIEEKIQDLEKDYNITYNEEQKHAIISSIEEDFLIITGGPGTGKTTITKGITELYQRINNISRKDIEDEIALLAPTGRAAKRMSESTNLSASTIHRFLKWQKETNKFQVNEYNKSKVKFIILDETSMIDTYLMYSLLKGISANCKIIMIGDDHQLPSVGPGQLLHDLISSKMLKTVELKELYRQQKDSSILSLAYDIRNGKINREIFNITPDLTFIKSNPQDIVDKIIEISQTYKDLSYKKFQILAPMYKGIGGIDEINKQMQSVWNESSPEKQEITIGETVFRENDKVIQLTNFPDENVYNGDIGIITKIIKSPKKEIYIDFDGNTVKYSPANFNSFKLAYAISIHKSQGSEFDVTIIPIIKNYHKMLYRKLIYTGITRSKENIYMIGDLDALDEAVENTCTDIRRTTIKEFLINGIK